MKNIVLSLLLMLIIITPVLARPATRVNPRGQQEYNHQYHFISDPAPGGHIFQRNPLDYAGNQLGMKVRDFKLPRAEENYYRLACRFPIIDYVSNNPLYMKQWAEDNSALIRDEHRDNGIGAVATMLDILRDVPCKPDLPYQQIEPTVSKFKDILYTFSSFTPEYQETLIDLVEIYSTARYLVEKAKEYLSEEDLEFFNANPGYFITPNGTSLASLTGNVDSHFNFIERARRVRYEYIFLAGEILAKGINDYVEATDGFTISDYYADESHAHEPGMIELEECIHIYGFADDTHKADTGFIIDLGGNDTYTNNAGGSYGRRDGVALCIDHSGNDIYSAPDRSDVQGFGFLGVGFLVDLAGDDLYIADHFSQGAGIMGVGALWDKSGDDDYIANAFCQGAGMFGLGALLDSSGEDFYDGATLCQGGATTLGMGVLSDLGGDDRYHLNIGPGKDNLGSAGYGQGGALSFRHFPWKKKLTAYGGVGMLLDGAGNDRYRTRGWCDQGGSYIMSLGVLVDETGNDHYTANTGQGSGIHVTNAILIDKDGHDVYEGSFRSGASGGDRSPGFLIDYHGNDTYKSGRACYGTGCKPFSYSLFIDYEGDDTYISPNPKGAITMNNWDSVGGVWPESEPYLWPYAICLDLGGKDDYQIRNRINNTVRHSFGHGIHIDKEWDGGDVIGEIENPLEPYTKWPRPYSSQDLSHKDLIQLLRGGDTFIRFQVIGHITRAEPDIVPELVSAISFSSRQYNRDIMECIHYFLVNGKITEKEIPELIKLLKTNDAEVRTIMADNFGIWKISEAEDALLEAAETDPYNQVRRFALNSLIALESKKGLSIARKLALADPSEDVRRIAVRYLSKVRNGEDPGPILTRVFHDDRNPAVKVAAIESISELQDDRMLDILREAAESFDVYMQRAAGEGLANLGRIEGIEILIESLSFPSIDAFFNYNRNVPNTISAYTGYDFPEGERYDQDAWRDWFEANKDDIDIEYNAEVFLEFQNIQNRLADASDEEQIEGYEEFLGKYPNHMRAMKYLADKLNSVAWNMATAGEDSPQYNPRQAVVYALRAVELEPGINFIDTLAEAYLAAGMIEDCIDLCNEMLEKHPGHDWFLKKLERCEGESS